MKLAHILIAIFCLLTYVLSIASQNVQIKKHILSNCQCKQCDLQHIDLSGFNPGKSFLKGDNNCHLTCDFSDSNLAFSNLENSQFITCIRGYITALKSASFKNANMQHANLKNTKFIGVSLQNANFSHADLNNVVLYLSDLSYANFSYANLSNAKSTADAMHGWGSKFQHANFSHAVLTSAELYGAFQNADFSHANLSHAKLITSEDAFAPNQVSNAALWEGVNFSYTNLKYTKIITVNTDKPNLSKAIFCHTIMPNGTINNRDCHHL